MSDLHDADAIIVSTHSQGSIVSTRLLNRPIQDNHITTTETFPFAIGIPETISRRKSKIQRVCCVALCGIHLGPLRYLSLSTLVQPYIQVSRFSVFDHQTRNLHLLFSILSRLLHGESYSSFKYAFVNLGVLYH